MEAQPQQQPTIPQQTGYRPAATPPGLNRAPVGRPQGDTPPPGLPQALAHQGTGQPLPNYQNPGVTAATMPTDQRTIYLLDLLSSSPDVSPDTRDWASTVLSILLQYAPQQQ